MLIIAPALPPRLDGIGDYTANFAAELSKFACVKILTAEGHAYTPIPGVLIEPAFSLTRPRGIRDLARPLASQKPDWVLIQYNPFSYGRWGLNLDLPLVVRELKRRHPGLRFAVMVHEPFVRIQSCQFAVMALWQRAQLRLLGGAADVIFVSIEPWAEELRRWFPRKSVRHLPVSSNIPYVPTTLSSARSRLSIAEGTLSLGLFGSVHPGYRLPWIRHTATALANAGTPVQVLYIGQDHQIVRSALGDIPVLGSGPVAAAEVSHRLRAMDIYLAPFVDGVSTRRTSLMAALQHGLPCVGTIGPNTGELLRREAGRGLLLAPVTEPDTFIEYALELARNEALRASFGQAAQALYEREFSWAIIIQNMLTALRESRPVG